MSEFRIDQIKSQDASRGPDVAGITTFTGTSGIVMPSGDTAYRGGRDRGIFAGSFPANKTLINTIHISTTGNAINFGTLANNRSWGMPSASSTRGIFAGGYSPGIISNIDFVTFSSGGGGNNFGDLRTATKQGSGFSDATRGIFATGAAPGVTVAINFVTIATGGSDSDFGDALAARRGGKGLASATRGVFARGGYSAGSTSDVTNVLEYVTIQTKGNSIEFGDRTSTHNYQGAAASNSTRGILAGGYTAPTNSNIIDYITIASTGNAQDFGDLTDERHGGGGMSNATRAVFAGLWNGDTNNIIDYVTIATTGNAVDFGDATTAIYYSNACSNAHGGLG